MELHALFKREFLPAPAPNPAPTSRSTSSCATAAFFRVQFQLQPVLDDDDNCEENGNISILVSIVNFLSYSNAYIPCRE